MLKMNYSDLKKKNYNQLIKECKRRGIQHYDSKGNIFPADDLIGRIIAYDAYYEGRDNALNGRPSKVEMNHKNERRKYCLRCEDTDPYYLNLTLDQYNLLNWCIRQEVWLPHAKIDEINDIIWETP